MKEIVCSGKRHFAGRRSIRLLDYDYSLPGSYFITTCVKNRKDLFGNIVNGEMRLNQYGRIVKSTWDDIINHYNSVLLDEFIVMPNHVHGIIIITNEYVGAIHESPRHMSVKERRQMLLTKIIGRFKMNSSKKINKIRNTPGTAVWQRNYYEHIIRNDKSYYRIQNYIKNNPQRWHFDNQNPANNTNAAFNQWLSILDE